MPAGLHIVRKLRPGKAALWYVYAWRGGPCIAKAEGARPKVTAELTDLAAERRRDRPAANKETLAGLIVMFKGSPEWAKFAISTRTNWAIWLDRIGTKFGTAHLKAFEDDRMRGDVLEWRNQWAAQPRSADMAIQAFSRLLTHGVKYGRLRRNVLLGVDDLYEVDRSEIIWEAEHFAAFNAEAAIAEQEAVELAACTGLRRGDLVQLPWSAIGEHAIVWDTGKSRKKNRAVIPILPETRALLDRIKARWAAEMAAKPERKRKPLPPTVLANSRWLPWTPSGLSTKIDRIKDKTGLTVRFHDLRGTFATRAIIAGLTDQEIADILGWSPNQVVRIRERYVDQYRVVVAIAERIQKSTRGG